MPFTPAHAAAALPLRRLRLVPSALVFGTFGPDFEYFIRLSPGGGFGHTFLGAFIFTLPLSLAVLWIYHAAVKAPLVSLLPTSIQRRLVPYLGKFHFLPARRFAHIALSLLIGIATHIAWDSFTHANRWPSRHWAILRETVRVPIQGRVPYFKLLQMGSTLVGLVILLAWCAHWYRATTPSTQLPGKQLTAAHKGITILFAVVLASVGAVIRIVPDALAQNGPLPWKRYAGYAICTWIALAWWQLVGYGILSSRRKSKTSIFVSRVG